MKRDKYNPDEDPDLQDEFGQYFNSAEKEAGLYFINVFN